MSEKEKLQVNLPAEPVVGDRPTLYMHKLEIYEDAISQFKEHIVSLVKRGGMSETVATRVVAENEYNFFQQIVGIEYK